jgi:hypothetical protein
LRALHSIVEGPREHHDAQAATQRLGIERRRPRTHSTIMVVEHANQIFGERRGGEDRHIDRWTRRVARGGDFHVTEIRLLAGPGGNRWDV